MVLDETVHNEHVLPDETENRNSVLLDKMLLSDTMIRSSTKTTNFSSDAYPDTTTTIVTLPEVMDSTSGALSNVSATETESNSRSTQSTMQPTISSKENGDPAEELLGATSVLLPDTTSTLSPQNML